MDDAERWWAVASGAVGLACLVAGSLLAALPRIDESPERALGTLTSRRSTVLVGSVLTVTAGALLIWPVAAVATSDGAVWTSLVLFSVGLAVLGAAVFAAVGLCAATVAWRLPDERDGAALLLQLAHLGTWSVSAPIGALLIVATTAAGVQADLLGPLVVVLAGAKVLTVAVELAGTGLRTGWNAGGWAFVLSGYVTVAWYALVLVELALA